MRLDLAQLKRMHPLLPATTAAEYCHRAGLGLERHGHIPGKGMAANLDGEHCETTLAWTDVGRGGEQQLDRHRITEDAAEAVSLALVSVAFGWTVRRRLQRGESADWLLLDSESSLVALEIGGLDTADGGRRLREKLSQAEAATVAGHRADTLEELGAPGAAAAHLDVSLLEERIAAGLPASDPEGALARRGAVRAAGAANDWRRARDLAERFIADADADAELREQLASLLAEDLDLTDLPVRRQQSLTKMEERGASEHIGRRAITRGPTVALSRDDIHGTPGRVRLRCLPQDAAAGLDVLGHARVRRERPGSAAHRYLDDLIRKPWGFEHRVYDTRSWTCGFRRSPPRPPRRCIAIPARTHSCCVSKDAGK